MSALTFATEWRSYSSIPVGVIRDADGRRVAEVPYPENIDSIDMVKLFLAAPALKGALEKIKGRKGCCARCTAEKALAVIDLIPRVTPC